MKAFLFLVMCGLVSCSKVPRSELLDVERVITRINGAVTVPELLLLIGLQEEKSLSNAEIIALSHEISWGEFSYSYKLLNHKNFDEITVIGKYDIKKGGLPLEYPVSTIKLYSRNHRITYYLKNSRYVLRYENPRANQ
jgi:hypothetical protein